MASHDGNVSAAGQLECGHQRTGGTTPALGLLDPQHLDRPLPTAGPEHHHHGLHAAIPRDTSSAGTDLSATSLHTRHLGRLRQHHDREDLNRGHESPQRPRCPQTPPPGLSPSCPKRPPDPPPALKLPGGAPATSLSKRGASSTRPLQSTRGSLTAGHLQPLRSQPVLQPRPTPQSSHLAGTRNH